MKKKIVIIGPSLQMGGIERASTNITNGLAELGETVFFIAIFRHPRFFKLQEIITFSEPIPGKNETKLDLLYTIRRIRKEVRAIAPDTVLVFNKFYAALVLLALRNLEIPVFVSDRASPFYRSKRPVEWFMKMVYGLFAPTGAIAQTPIAAEHQRKYFSQHTKIRVIPNAVRDITLYPEIAREKIILGVGRLSDRLKGFDRLIEAFALVENREWQLVFAGGTDGAEHLISLVEENHLTSRVTFLGRVEEMDRLYAQAGIFVIPSRSEGFPNALCEAMAAGVPCVSFDFIAGPRDIIQPGHTGLIVPESDISALAKAINDLIDQPHLRAEIGKNATTIRSKLSLEAITKRFRNFITSNPAEDA